MKFLSTLALAAPITAISLPDSQQAVANLPRDSSLSVRSSFPQTNALSQFDRRDPKGGGGRGGGGGGGRVSSGSTGGSAASAPVRNFGSRGNSYAGGSSTLYRSGARRGGIAPYAIGGAALGVLGFAALAGAGAYIYYFDDDSRVSYYNQTAQETQTANLRCLCEQDLQCSCDRIEDDDDRTDYVESLIGDGSVEEYQDNGVRKAGNGTLYVDASEDADATGAAGDSARSPGGWAGGFGFAILTAAVGAGVLLV